MVVQKGTGRFKMYEDIEAVASSFLNEEDAKLTTLNVPEDDQFNILPTRYFSKSLRKYVINILVPLYFLWNITDDCAKKKPFPFKFCKEFYVFFEKTKFSLIFFFWKLAKLEVEFKQLNLN